MNARLLITGKNYAIPSDIAQSVSDNIAPRWPWTRCKGCDGDGYYYAQGINPSEKPAKLVCDQCNGEGVFPIAGVPSPRQQAARSATPPGRRAAPFNSPSGIKPGAVAAAEQSQSHTLTNTHRRPAALSPVAGRFWFEVVEFLTVTLGLLTFGGLAFFMWIFA